MKNMFDCMNVQPRPQGLKALGTRLYECGRKLQENTETTVVAVEQVETERSILTVPYSLEQALPLIKCRPRMSTTFLCQKKGISALALMHSKSNLTFL